MKALIQRVKSASVSINGKEHSSINKGMLVLFCVEKNDDESCIDWMVNKISKLRIFEDEFEKMNLSIKDVTGEIMVVSQFTLAGDCKKGTRPSFDNAAPPETAETYYNLFVEKLKKENLNVKTGKFRAMMDVSLVNWGPVTFMIEKKT